MNQYKIVRIEYNVRPVEDLGNVALNSIAFYDELEKNKLHEHDIWLPNVCILDFDIEGVHWKCGDVLYDLAIVKTEKPLDYWTNIFK